MKNKLTRENLATISLEKMYGHLCDGHYLTDSELLASLHCTLKQRPDASPVWIFGYGSLIWNPIIHFQTCRKAYLPRWRRAFCMKLTAGRATEDLPGRMLALVPGCGIWGMAYQLDEASLESELRLLWKREMCTNSYIPTWEQVTLDDGQTANVLVFVMRQEDHTFDCHYEPEVVACKIAQAAGPLGSNAEYVRLLQHALEQHDMHDPYISSLVLQVNQAESHLQR